MCFVQKPSMKGFYYLRMLFRCGSCPECICIKMQAWFLYLQEWCPVAISAPTALTLTAEQEESGKMKGTGSIAPNQAPEEPLRRSRVTSTSIFSIHKYLFEGKDGSMK